MSINGSEHGSAVSVPESDDGWQEVVQSDDQEAPAEPSQEVVTVLRGEVGSNEWRWDLGSAQENRSMTRVESQTNFSCAWCVPRGSLLGSLRTFFGLYSCIVHYGFREEGDTILAADRTSQAG